MATPDICPNCGELVPEGAKACPECGACEETGWSDNGRADALGIPHDDDDFKYDEFVRRELEGLGPPPRKWNWVWTLTALILLVVFGSIFFALFK
jgi:hypothetical protein